ncbi:glycosyl transferase family 1 [Mangrovimonas yunxiaonensis]|uniref:Glycosyl transferase family 1 n=1 Tax=Mangrovimonas yunxiaonensis TaxID=1197477 RepID=A0A084TNU3_9FLAO|nr:glycosyltransferase [Mangrovimonas yunxiaonensis]KFB02379.1 glycosyl transferase family 1 [Mangrovimonas yunxiaonensis]GGH39981.1 glycosyl transferase family 1 [Mangrovimonas yunxiaonensis]
MRILLVGEYSRLHNSLKEGLISLGHEVVIIGSGDAFKNYPVDIHLKEQYNNGLSWYIKRFIYKLLKIDITSISLKNQFNNIKHKLINFDYVQLINENSLNTIPNIEQELLTHIFENNKTVYLLSCGADYLSIKHTLNKKFRYSILTPFFNKDINKKDIWHSLKFATKPYKKLHNFIVSNCNGIIASDIDYHIPLLKHSKYLGLIPNPINIEKIKFSPIKVNNKINIFLGINTLTQIKKGIPFFEEALNIIQKKHPEKVDIKITKNLPYNEYINIYNKAHIVLDQVYAYDQGYNALEAMAKGKVVFTGAEKEWLDHYDLKEDTVAINALPDVNQIVKKLEWLIQNPKKIENISINARAFIEKEHHYISIAQWYLDTWKKND